MKERSRGVLEERVRELFHQGVVVPMAAILTVEVMASSVIPCVAVVEAQPTPPPPLEVGHAVLHESRQIVVAESAVVEAYGKMFEAVVEVEITTPPTWIFPPATESLS